ncbi:MAG: 4'-phosphopantetheinyl transferase family protein [Pseudomonadota bacterium]
MEGQKAIKIHSLVMQRTRVNTAFAEDELLRATLAVIPLDHLSEDRLGELISANLQTDELSRLQALEHSKRRQSFATGRLAAKLAIQAHHKGLDPRDISIASGVFEQPVIAATIPGVGETGISISHSARYAAALAFHRAHPMGLDIDLPARAEIEPVLSELAPEERHLLDDLELEEAAAATLIWVARESLAKTLTTGMMTPLSIYTPSSIERQEGVFVLRYRNFAQYRTLVWPGAQGWLGVTLPERTQLDPPSVPWR